MKRDLNADGGSPWWVGENTANQYYLIGRKRLEEKRNTFPKLSPSPTLPHTRISSSLGGNTWKKDLMVLSEKKRKLKAHIISRTNQIKSLISFSICNNRPQIVLHPFENCFCFQNFSQFFKASFTKMRWSVVGTIQLDRLNHVQNPQSPRTILLVRGGM